MTAAVPAYSSPPIGLFLDAFPESALLVPPALAPLLLTGDEHFDLVILPYQHETVWWYEAGRFEQKFYGSHGGLSREEMETLLLVQSYG